MEPVHEHHLCEPIDVFRLDGQLHGNRGNVFLRHAKTNERGTAQLAVPRSCSLQFVLIETSVPVGRDDGIGHLFSGHIEPTMNRLTFRRCRLTDF